MAVPARIVFLLPLLFVTVLCRPKKNECVFNSESNTIKPFYTSSRPTLANTLPCTYKVANIKCGAAEAEVIAQNGLDGKGRAHLSDVVVKITNHRDDGITTVQNITLSVDAFLKVVARGKSKSVWKWSWSGDRKPSKKERVKAKHSKRDKSTRVSVGRLTVSVRMPGRTVAISCADQMSALEDLSETLCGSPDDTKASEAAWMTGLDRELRLWDTHKGDNLGDYWLLAKHRVQQTNPLCAEASNVIRAGQCTLYMGELGTHLHDCRVLAYSRCVASTGLDPFQMYVACLGVLCGADGPTPRDTCSMLSEAKASCGTHSLQHVNIDAILSYTDCQTGSAVTTTPTPEEQAFKLSGDECSETPECGPCAVCTGSPALCTCNEGYISDHGRCGLAVGKEQSELCFSDAQCVSHTVCSMYRCLCQPEYMVNHVDSLCYKRVGQTCSADDECMKDAVCSGGTCACEPNRQLGEGKGYSYQPEVYCYLKLGESCQSTNDCGLNAECTGSPAVCVCRAGYINENGRCGKAVGTKCDTVQQCVTGAFCSGKCRCYSGYQTLKSFCSKLETCKYSSGRQGTLVSRFDGTESQYFDPLPCRYKMTDFQCGKDHTMVTLDNTAKNGVVSIATVTISVTSANDDGSKSSQTYVLTPESSIQKITGLVNITLSDKGQTLSITCSSSDFWAYHTYPHNFCGGPLQTGATREADASSGMVVDPYYQRYIEHDIVALVKQNVQQTDSLCQEASEIASSKCRHLPSLMYEIRHNQNWCLKKNKKDISYMQYYVAAMRAVCGTTGAQNPALSTCDSILNAASYCGYGEHSLVTINDFLRMNKCSSSFTPTTTASTPPDGYDPAWK